MSTTSTASRDRDGRFGSLSDAKSRLHVLQALTGDPAADRLEHLPLHVLREHHAVRSDAASQMDREPAGAGADVCDRRAVRDAERIHDLVGLLPRLPVGSFEQPEILGREQPAMPVGSEPAACASSRSGRGASTPARWPGRRDDSRKPSSVPSSPTIPGRVMLSTDRYAIELPFVHQALLQDDLARSSGLF